MKKIQLNGKHGKGIFIRLDDEDFEKCKKYKWYLSSGYAISKKNKKTIYIHRFILDAPDSLQVDHKDRDKMNNQKSNLRLCTSSQNLMNKYTPNGKSKYKGVHLENNRFRARIELRDNGKRKSYHLGYFLTEAEAALAYNVKAKELFGEFAYLNKI